MANAHDHFSFSNRETAIAAFKALKDAGYNVTEFEGFTSVGGHSATGGHFGAAGQDPTYDDASDGVAFDVPWGQFGSGPIGESDFKKSRKVAEIVKQAISGQLTDADGNSKKWDAEKQQWVASDSEPSEMEIAEADKQRKICLLYTSDAADE